LLAFAELCRRPDAIVGFIGGVARHWRRSLGDAAEMKQPHRGLLLEGNAVEDVAVKKITVCDLHVRVEIDEVAAHLFKGRRSGDAGFGAAKIGG
jgi:hypothetical protein